MRVVLAVASGGGHSAQMDLLRPAFDDCDVIFASPQQAGADVRVLTDCNLRQPLRALRCAVQVLRLVAKTRPDVVVSTGAAPGAFAVMIGKAFGARTIWVDSVANVERLSVSGRLVRPCADMWVSQWPELAQRNGASFAGRLL